MTLLHLSQVTSHLDSEEQKGEKRCKPEASSAVYLDQSGSS